jgi:MFS family permease
MSLFHNSGFIHTVIAFSIAECSINTFSAFLVPLLRPLGFDKTLVGYLGTAFILACMLGSAIIGAYVDRTKKYTSALIGSMVGVIISLLALTYLVMTTMPVAVAVGRHNAASHTTHSSITQPLVASTTGGEGISHHTTLPTPTSPAGLSAHAERNMTHHHHVPPPEHALNPWPITICLLVPFICSMIQHHLLDC